MKLILPKWRNGAWRSHMPAFWCYATALSTTWALYNDTDNPWLFFWFYLLGLLVMHHGAFTAGEIKGINIARASYEANTAMIERMMEKDSLAAVQAIIDQLGSTPVRRYHNDKFH